MQSDEEERNNEELSKELRALVKKIEKDLSLEDKQLCRIDTDCPLGYVCAFGQCVKKVI